MIILLATERTEQLSLALTALVPALVAAFVGFLDDRQHLNPYLRLALQAGVGVLAFALGTRLSVTGTGWVDGAILVLWVMIVINGTNLLDNSDGLAGSTVFVAALGSSIVAYMYGQFLVCFMGVALAGVAAGFLWHNWFPAKVYMGDAGRFRAMFHLTVRLRPGVRLPESAWPSRSCWSCCLWSPRRHALADGNHRSPLGDMSHVLQNRGASVRSVVFLQRGGRGSDRAVALALSRASETSARTRRAPDVRTARHPCHPDQPPSPRGRR
jgi:hypothetical protein